MQRFKKYQPARILIVTCSYICQIRTVLSVGHNSYQLYIEYKTSCESHISYFVYIMRIYLTLNSVSLIIRSSVPVSGVCYHDNGYIGTRYTKSTKTSIHNSLKYNFESFHYSNYISLYQQFTLRFKLEMHCCEK